MELHSLIQQATALVQEQLQSNQFLSGGALLMVIGALGMYLRALPGQIYRFIRRRFFIDFEINMNDDAFYWFNDWLAEQNYTKKWSRYLSVRTTRRGRRDNEAPKIILSPAPGSHWMFWKGYFMIVDRDRQEDSHGGNNNKVSGGMASIARERFDISILTWKRNIITKLLEEARAIAHPPGDDRITVYTPYYSEWNSDTKCRPRPMDSVILRGEVMQDLAADLNEFIDNEERYVARGIPYRRGYLLYGPPGNGKSSAVIALASHLKLDICVINLGTPSLGDDDLRDLMAKVPPHSIVLVEDIDCVFEQRESTDDNESKITFSGLLNALDGVVASEGRILFMSTNHIEKLDPALIRPGRCDVKLLIKNANQDQGRRLFERFHPDRPDLAERFGELVGDELYSMAELQGHLMTYQLDPVATLQRFTEISNAKREAETTNGVQTTP